MKIRIMDHDEESVRILFTNSGSVVDEGHREKIFEKFFQEDSSSTRKHGGSGLGLYIAKAVVELHDGTIRILESSEEETTVEIILPVY